MPEALDQLYDEAADEKPASIRDLKRKMRLQGTVVRTELFGAFVDVGVDVHGLVHISQLRSERVNRVSEVVNAGDEVTVWVMGVNLEKKRIDLTMIEPPEVEWDDIQAGQVFTGTVKRLERFGAFVDIGATRDGLVHVSEITSDYIQDPKEYVKVGDEIQVKVLGVDNRRRRIELSMKALEEHLAVEEDEELEEAPTAMEQAWRQATGSRGGPDRRSRRKKGRRRRGEDDIFSRTLAMREDQE